MKSILHRRSALSGAVFLGVLSFALVGCGTPGAPMPPSLHLPVPPDDLQAVRKGDKVFLTWSSPIRTTDKEGIKSPGKARICRSYRTQPDATCGNVASELPSPLGPNPTKMEFVDDLSPVLKNSAQDYVTYNIEVENSSGRSAGPSNAVTVFLAPSMSAPENVKATLDEETVTITWTPPAIPQPGRLKATFFNRVRRQFKDGGKAQQAEEVAAEVENSSGPTSVKDKAFAWEKNYVYWVTGVTQVLSSNGKVLAEFEGESSSPVELTTHDVFPPAHPQGMQAVYSGVETQKSIDLTWSPNQEHDLAGYNVYRREGEASAVRINQELIKTPSFRDNAVNAGKTYSYQATAVDARGNESAKSEAATERVPE